MIRSTHTHPLVFISSARIWRWLAVLAVSLSCLGVSSQALSATFSAQSNRTEISINDQLSVTFRLRGGNHNSEPDFSPVQNDFEILSSYRTQKSTNINGKHDAFYEWTLTLAPKRLGQLVVPSIRVAGAQSESISISVNEAPDNPAAAGSELFMTIEPDKSSVYVQEQVLLKARIYSRNNFDAQEISDFTLDDALVEAITEDKYVTEVSGTPYAVYELTFALYPQKSGTLSIPAVDYAVRLRANRRSMLSFGGGDVRRGRSSPVTLEVKPIPAANGSGPWLPASDIKLAQHFSHDSESLTAGEPITRSITLTAEGLHPSQLPPVTPADVEGFSTYADKPQTQERRTNSGITSERTDTIAMVPSTAGRKTLPPVELKWFNTTTGEFETARLPAVQTNTTMPVGGSSPAPATAPELPTTNGLAASSSGNTLGGAPRWLLVTQGITLVLLILMTALYLGARKRRHTAQPKPTNKADHGDWRSVKKEAAKHNLPALRLALLHWAEHHYQRPIARLEQIAQLANNEERAELLQQLRQLDQAIYRPDGPEFDPGKLLPLIQKQRVRKRDAQGTNLAPLYPS
ncbi:BatD family protein [Gilvimarinus agarilyticus]|uniref:BatD family protein n=1 Tax=Gilvimarinus agarilyticus TaxID=679259 RepID=UPI00059EF7A9|nr:BatD family protein [Gilvimarinus agarilyticus]